MRQHRIFVGTVGEGIFRSLDHGETFRRAAEGMFVECHVRALVVHPHDPKVLYLGSEKGVFVSTDAAEKWVRMDAPLDGLQVWSIWVGQQRPELLVVGTCPSRIFRSADGGQTWSEAQTQMLRDCPRIMHTRVTSLLGDPDNPDRLWAGVEIDGLHQSDDGGKCWRPVGTGMSSRDIHALALVPAANGRGRCMLAATNNDLNRSTDDGQTWQPMEIGKSLPWSYCRALAQRCGQPHDVFLGQGDAPPGCVGAVARSRDGGSTWELADMPGRANSTMWNFALHPADPALVYAASVSGQLYRSVDGGACWTKLPREFGEVRALAWAPV